MGNKDCFICVGRVLETFSDPSLAMGSRDAQCAICLLQPFLKLHSALEKQNDDQLSVRAAAVCVWLLCVAAVCGCCVWLLTFAVPRTAIVRGKN